MSITKTEDYISRFAISQNKYTTPQLQDFIDHYEEKYLKDLLGTELYNLLIADLDPITGEPQTQRFIDIWEPFDLDTNYCHQHIRLESEGIPEMLKNFNFFEYARKQGHQNTIVGTVRAAGENSSPIPNQNTYMDELYNTGVMSYLAIAYLVKSEPDIYPEYKGKLKEFKTPLF